MTNKDIADLIRTSQCFDSLMEKLKQNDNIDLEVVETSGVNYSHQSFNTDNLKQMYC